MMADITATVEALAFLAKQEPIVKNRVFLLTNFSSPFRLTAIWSFISF